MAVGSVRLLLVVAVMIPAAVAAAAVLVLLLPVGEVTENVLVVETAVAVKLAA